MNSILCLLSHLSIGLIKLYIGVLLVYAIISWLPSLRGAWTNYLEMLVEPLLIPLRRIIPPLGGFDLSFLLLFFVLQLLLRAIETSTVCYVAG